MHNQQESALDQEHLNNNRHETQEMIVTIKPESIRIGMQELKDIDSKMKIVEWLDDGIAVVHVQSSFQHIATHFMKKPPIFIQHICPVNEKVKTTNSREDLVQIAELIIEKKLYREKPSTFSVQTRFSDDVQVDYKKFEMNQAISEKCIAQGLELDVKKPEQIISVFVASSRMYIGSSLSVENVSDWAGGKRRFAMEKGQVSRAQFKLLEVLEMYDLVLPEGGEGLDLGAAPGGWTNVLIHKGMNVTAVDPALLHPSIKKHAQVRYVKETAQTFFKQTQSKPYDIIVNDMRIDTYESVDIMMEAYDVLKYGGFIVFTLKMPKRNMMKRLKYALHLLQRKYDIVGVKQLFHNRSEVTVVLVKSH
ncbi:SAM-dependent methyltransferase [Longirhabdus pacifica]|uniref:SAM-dependent methyltransferase n=1 Tax=Longirhabdus pacifica TaxID=2305227 RepID=UPI001008859E|nr:SAM-dependent methyltransferase [Longirhabdus pacifica]